MKSPSKITTIPNESSTRLSSATDQVSKSLISNDNTEQICMKSPFEITTIPNKSSTKLSSTTNQVSKSLISNNNTEQICMNSPSDITTITNESSTSSIINNNTEQCLMKSPSEINTITNESSTKLSSITNQVSKSSITNNNCNPFSMKSPSVITTNQVSKSKSPDPTLINNNNVEISTLKRYDTSMYYYFDACLGDNNNIKIYVRRSITLKIRLEGVEDSNKIGSINLSSSILFMNDIRQGKQLCAMEQFLKINHWIHLI